MKGSLKIKARFVIIPLMEKIVALFEFVDTELRQIEDTSQNHPITIRSKAYIKRPIKRFFRTPIMKIPNENINKLEINNLYSLSFVSFLL